jgi:hypothetical protein
MKYRKILTLILFLLILITIISVGFYFKSKDSKVQETDKISSTDEKIEYENFEEVGNLLKLDENDDDRLISYDDDFTSLMLPERWNINIDDLCLSSGDRCISIVTENSEYSIILKFSKEDFDPNLGGIISKEKLEYSTIIPLGESYMLREPMSNFYSQQYGGVIYLTYVTTVYDQPEVNNLGMSFGVSSNWGPTPKGTFFIMYNIPESSELDLELLNSMDQVISSIKLK